MVWIGPEAEFFHFDDIRFDNGINYSYYYLDSIEGQWNSGRVENPNLGYKPALQRAYFPVPPMDRSRTCAPRWCLLQQWACTSSASTTRLLPAGQAEIDIKAAPLVRWPTTWPGSILYKNVP